MTRNALRANGNQAACTLGLTDSTKPEDIARMEREMELLGRDFLMIEESHGRNTLNLVLAVAYLRKILDNAGVVKYLSQRHPDILSEFQKLAESPDLKSAS